MRRLNWFKTSLFIMLSLFVCIHLSVANGVSLDSITISPASSSITLDQAQQFIVTGNYSDGSRQDLTASSRYELSDTSVANINEKGIATPVASGSTVIEIKYHGKRAEATLTVLPIYISSGAAALAIGSTTIIASSSRSLIQ